MSRSYLIRKRVRVLLRENRLLEGYLHMAEGQSLTGVLGVKKFFLNLTDVRWIGGVTADSPIPHLAIRVNQIVWIQPLEEEIRLTSFVQPESQAREVELHLIGNISLDVRLHIAPEQRMSDYFDSNPGFVPLRDAKLTASGELHPELAVNQEAVLAIRELDSEADRDD